MDDFIIYQGLKLPPERIPRHGKKDDPSYVKWALRNVAAAEGAGMTKDSRVLDIGCGAGRFLTGMLAKYGRVNSYFGLDVRKAVIDWCQKELTDPVYGNVRFEWVNIENTRYNKALGQESATMARLPVENGSVDMVVLFSVFSHMTYDDTAAYLKEIRRVLAPNGACFCSAYVEDDVPRWTENPQGYLGKTWKGPLHCVRFERKAFDGLVSEAGLKIADFVHQVPPAKQSAYTLRIV
jgi:SAM-dependent methyltransferase